MDVDCGYILNFMKEEGALEIIEEAVRKFPRVIGVGFDTLEDCISVDKASNIYKKARENNLKFCLTFGKKVVCTKLVMLLKRSKLTELIMVILI